ncbi:MAG: nucleotidyltransferase family protein [Thermoplasmata archaeon]
MPDYPDAALILSGGTSRRWGGTPKAGMRLGSESAIQHLVRISVEEGFAPIIVVVGVHEDFVRRQLRDSVAEIVRNETWELGRTGSVQRGLAALPSGANTLIWPIDHPFVEAKTLRALHNCGVSDRMASWFIPTYEGRGGHPVLIRPSAAREVAGLSVDAPLRSVVSRLGPQVRRLPVDDPFVLANVDSREEYNRIIAQWPRSPEDTWIVD